MSAKCRIIRGFTAVMQQQNSNKTLQCRTAVRRFRPLPSALQVPAGVLYVKLIEATNVPNMDIFSKTDPLVKLFVRKRNERRSRTIFNSLHPRCLDVLQLKTHHMPIVLFQKIRAAMVALSLCSPLTLLSQFSMFCRWHGREGVPYTIHNPNVLP